MQRSISVLAILMFLGLTALSFAQSADETLMTNERNLWAAFKNKDSKPFEEWLTPDLVDISLPEAKVRDRAAVIKSMQDYNITDYSLSDMKVTMLDTDTALLTYRVTSKGTGMGHPLPEAPMVCSSVWIRKDGKWWGRFHQETPVMQSEMHHH